MTAPELPESNTPPSAESPPEAVGLLPPVPELATVGADSLPAGAPPDGDDERAVEGHAAVERQVLDRRVAAVVEGMSDAFLAIGPDWRVRWANREAARLAGTTVEALLGCDHWERWPQTVGTELEREYRRVAEERTPGQLEHHYPSDGIWHDVRVYPSDDGGIAVFYRDISAEKRAVAERARQARELSVAHEKALAVETQFRLLVDRVNDYAVFVMDADGVVTHWGHGAERMKGWRADQAVGLHLRELYPSQGRAEDGTADEHLRHAALHGEYIGEGTRQRSDGVLFPARVVLTALRRDGQLVGFSKITQNLSAERARADALREATRAAEAASVAKSQFLANTSHEIRTPLNAVIGYAELLDVGLAGPLTAQQRQYVSRIQDTSRHLLALVNDVLDLSKIEAGQMWAAREPALVHEAVAAALRLVEPQARARGVVLANACRDLRTAFRGDPERVRQIVVNLLSNAVRFTESGGRVSVSCGITAAAPRGVSMEDPASGPVTFIRVEDTGIGIPPDQLDRIWQAFEQGDASRTRRFGGSGLGLTISRHLARLMGGDITVSSRDGLGSSFVIWLPAADPADVVIAERAEVAADGPSQHPEQALAEVAPTEAQGLTEISDALLTESERVISTYVARLRTDAELPSARGLADAQLEDHGVTFLVDVSQCLTVVGNDGPEATEMLRDGSAIQRLIASRHGAQRARLGWGEDEVRREWRVLLEEVQAAVQRRVTRVGTDAERAVAILNHFFAQAERVCITSYRATVSGAPRQTRGAERP